MGRDLRDRVGGPILKRRLRAVMVLGLAVGLVATLVAPPALAARDPREAKGRALFAKGDYQAALDIYANLFSEHADPVYLRNIGRCYQKLRQPERAIDSFNEYLRRSPRLKPSEREEIEGFVKEMEALKTSMRSEPTSPPRGGETSHPDPGDDHTVSPIPAARADSGGAGPQTRRPASLIVAKTPETENPPEEKPIYTRWWFWAGVGGVVVAGVATALILSSRGTTLPDCPMGSVCPH